MMSYNLILLSAAALLGLGIIAASLLRGWQGWLQLKLRELEQHRPEVDTGIPGGTARIELADLKERIRKLEAIAAGVDL
jgi:hypothetical protein